MAELKKFSEMMISRSWSYLTPAAATKHRPLSEWNPTTEM
ncbi:hypothetical protein T03_8819 [Trichinella britovi]|uniref:Uncharacterized protein n=1 Tax=Trichinella britovi TaxID=45882 RepID=A0A0V0Z647_TRIBR|nr:hypothetical protein T03_8819 [Trichinella britovi]